MYQPTDWKDRVVEKPRTFTVTNNPDGTITLAPSPGTVVEEGTPVNAVNLNQISQALFDAYYQAPFLETATTELIYDAGNLVRVDESVASVLRRRTALSYSGSDLSTVNVKIYDEDGATLVEEYTDTLNYSGGNLVSVGRVVA